MPATLSPFHMAPAHYAPIVAGTKLPAVRFVEPTAAQTPPRKPSAQLAAQSPTAEQVAAAKRARAEQDKRIRALEAEKEKLQGELQQLSAAVARRDYAVRLGSDNLAKFASYIDTRARVKLPKLPRK